MHILGLTISSYCKVPIPWGAVCPIQKRPQSKISCSNIVLTRPVGQILYAKKTKERTSLQLGGGAKQKTPQYTPRSNMASLPEDLQGLVMTESQTPSEKS